MSKAYLDFRSDGTYLLQREQHDLMANILPTEQIIISLHGHMMRIFFPIGPLFGLLL